MSVRTALRRLSLCLALAASSLSAWAQQMPLVPLTAGMYRITAELAHTPQTRQVGLMNRESMAENRGMVFVFDFEAAHCMWMKNTLIPLSVAFLSRDGTVINIEDMQPQTETTHCAKQPARFALEMNRGWFAERGIAAGDHIGGVDRLRPAQ